MGAGADAWIVVPVGAHRALVERVASAKGFSVSPSALDRTSVLYIGVYPAPSATRDGSSGPKAEAGDLRAEASADVRLLATGSFPKSASSIVFPRARGWERAGTDHGVAWYRSGSMGAAIPRSGLFAMARDFPALLSNLSSPVSVPPSIPADFEAYLESPGIDGRVAFMMASPEAGLAGFLPAGMTLPLDHALFFADRVEAGPSGGSDTYALTGYLEARDERSTRAVAALLRLATGTRPRIQGDRVYLDNWQVDIDTLAAFAGL